MAGAIGGIGGFRDIGDPYDPRRQLGQVPSQLNIPGIAPGNGAVPYAPSYIDDVASYMARQARQRYSGIPGNADPATGFYEPDSGQLSLNIRPGRSSAESILVPQSEAELYEAIEAARRDNRPLPVRVATPAKGDNQGRPIGILLGGEVLPRARPEEREDTYTVGRALQTGAYTTFPDGTYLTAIPKGGDIARGALQRLNSNPEYENYELGKRTLGGFTPEGERVGSLEVVKKRRQSRLGRRADFVSESQGYAPLTTPELAEAMLARKAAKKELSESEQALMAVQLMRRAAESPEERAFLDEYAQELSDIVRAEGFGRDETDRNVDVTGFSSEDPYEFKAKASGRNLKTIEQKPNWREREPVSYVSDDGGAGLPWYRVEALQRQPDGQWKQGGQLAYGGVDPSQLVAVPPGYEREGDFNEDATASFLREKEITVGEVVGRMLNDAKTPVIGKDALVDAWKSGRFKPISKAEQMARQAKARLKGSKDTLVGYIEQGGVKQAVYKTDLVSDRLVPDPQKPLTGVIKEGSEIYRVGSPVNRDYTDVRDYVRALVGSTPEKGMRGEITLAPLVSDTGVRRTVEREMGGISQSEFFNQIAAGAMMMDPDESNALRGVLAEAASTGEMPVFYRATKDAPRAKGTKPMRGTVESLYSGIDPKTGRNPKGQDAPEVTAGKQLRAFLQEAPRPLTTQEAVEVAGAIGARWGVDANAALRAAAAQTPAMGRSPEGKLVEIPGRMAPANDPGRALFGEDSYALQLLRQAQREGTGRQVDLFAEPPATAPITDDMAVLLGSVEGADWARLQEARDLRFQSTAPMERLVGEDPLASYVEYAKQFTSGDEFVVEEALKNSPGSITEDYWKNPGQTQLGPIRAIDEFMNEFMASPAQTVQVGTSKPDPVEVDRIRMAYRPSPEGTVRPAGVPATATFDDLARVIGGEVGSDTQEQAMAFLANRIAQRAQNSYEGAGLTGASEPRNREAAMARRRALGVLGR